MSQKIATPNLIYLQQSQRGWQKVKPGFFNPGPQGPALHVLVGSCSNTPDSDDQLVIKLCWGPTMTRSFDSGVLGQGNT